MAISERGLKHEAPLYHSAPGLMSGTSCSLAVLVLLVRAPSSQHATEEPCKLDILPVQGMSMLQ